MNQTELGRKFAAGYSVGRIRSASNVEVVAADSDEFDAYIVGYGWAVYAARKANARDEIVFFDGGWRGYSHTTSQQLTRIRAGFEEVTGEAYDEFVTMSDERPTTDEPPEVAQLVGKHVRDKSNA